MSQIEFKIGGKYENMKGPYEVLSMDGDYMHIRWESGEEITTEVDFQRRVIERMQFEREQRSAKKAKKMKKAAGATQVKFEGFQKDDFSRKIAGTTWRRRSCLGRMVKVFPDSDRFDIKSWSIARKPMIQWADTNHRNPENFNFQGKFFVRLDEDSLYCGFCIERPKDSESENGDWDAFMDWLMKKENEERLKELAIDHELSILNLKRDGNTGWKVEPDNDDWKLIKNGKEKPLQSLPQFLNDLTGNGKRVDLYISKEMEKDDAISRSDKIADVISRTFESLFPIYEASAVNGSNNPL